jgi:D-serine deaminase-like pyridoxal phosphate-dependent protein
MTTAGPPDSSATFERYESILAGLEPPFAFVDLDALWINADYMVATAGGKPIRVASKSIRCRALLRRILDHSRGYRGLLNLTLPEALWLYEHGFRDLLVAYPSPSLTGLGRLAALAARDPDGAPAVMVDSIEHLELIEAAVDGGAPPIRVCIDVDVGYRLLRGRIKFGPKRSPIHTPEDAAALAQEIERRPAVKLVGVMAYEGQIAGVADHVPSRTLENLLIRGMKLLSVREVAERRAAIVAAVSAVSELQFVNGGGTGSIASTAAERTVTEVAAGSGFYAPMLFQYYRSLRLAPAAGFALPVGRKASADVVTALGGGYIASGAVRPDRQPVPVWPLGLRLDPLEGAGEAQTPLVGKSAERLRIGDRVYFRHAKAGELCERFNVLHVIEGERIADETPTYRGEGMCFL